MTSQAMPGRREIGRKKFSQQDQEAFASLSHDRNPMHMDPVAARRLLTGRPVVHGIHVLLTALEYWTNEQALAPVYLDCTFNNAVNVDDVVVFTQKSFDERRTVIEASVDGLLCAKVTLAVSQAASQSRSDVTQGELKELGNDSFPPFVSTPLNEAPEYYQHRKYVVRTDPIDLSGHFPQVCLCFGSTRAAGLLALSYFIGMVCPGLNSIFSSVNLKLDDRVQDADAISFSVDQYDARFRLFHFSLEGGLVGSLTAFLRPPPQQQLTMAEISKHVSSGEFKGTRSLVIGASRGLGEMTAKILAAGGGDVIISYARGLTDIENVNAEINASGLGTSEIRQLDVTSGSFGGLDFESLDAIYLFATPRIYRKKLGVFNAALFEEFLDFYVRSLYDLCLQIEAAPLKGNIKIYVPSSVFISERPEGMAEYAMAKAAAEVIIEDINRSFKNVSVVATRLPRLSTDQTSSILNVPAGDNLAVLLAVVRYMAKWTRPLTRV